MYTKQSTDVKEMNRKMEMEKTFNYFFIILVGEKGKVCEYRLFMTWYLWIVALVSIEHGVAYRRGKRSIWLEL